MNHPTNGLRVRIAGLGLLASLAIAIGIGACGKSAESPAPGGCPTLIDADTNTTVASHGPLMSKKANFVHLQSHIPKNRNQYAEDGQLPADQTLDITIALPLQHEAELDQLIHDLYDPSNKLYHHFITRTDFVARYAPSLDQLAKVRDYLKTQNVSIGTVNTSLYLIRTQARVSALNKLFNTEIRRFRDSKRKDYYAPAYELQIPKNVPIRAVHGLHNMATWKSHLVQARGTHVPIGDSTASPGLTPAMISTAYQLPTADTLDAKNNPINGNGETLALFELDGFNPLDIQAYNLKNQLRNVPLSVVPLDGVSTSPGANTAEVTIDIELVNAIAPGASKIIVYEGANSPQGVLDLYSRIANDNSAREVSTSWGAAEGDNTVAFLQTENTIFKQMAAQGQTVFAASGDLGAFDNGSSLSVDDPASQPYVVGVGGTRLKVTLGGEYEHESAWNTANVPSEGAGGGGISTVWAQPSYQDGMISAASLGSGTARNVPDVSLSADPATGYSVFFSTPAIGQKPAIAGKWQTYGGTSCAAPIWAAFAALVNQQRISQGLSSLGFINPVLYQIGLSTEYPNAFSDVNDETNNIVYPAVTGYDDATGLGSIKGEALFDDLTTDSLSLTPTPKVKAAVSNPTGC